jgi:alkanesulfonate monooxygenase SsuD/methylene tetrahydromethanopterin reductase-like flavin-dependent oxidoreductase (luciferase family)
MELNRANTVAKIAKYGGKAEQLGGNTVWASETQHAPLLQLALVAEHTEFINLGTNIASAFRRSSMTLAYTA